MTWLALILAFLLTPGLELAPPIEPTPPPNITTEDEASAEMRVYQRKTRNALIRYFKETALFFSEVETQGVSSYKLRRGCETWLRAEMDREWAFPEFELKNEKLFRRWWAEARAWTREELRDSIPVCWE